MSKILLTGATGFIGSHVAELFCEKEERLYCLVRKNADIQYIKDLPVKIVYGDITNIDELKEATKEVSTVIHIAAKAADWGEYDDFYKVNVTGTMNVLTAGYENNVNHIIITGSISSYGEENSNKIKNEDSPYNSHYKYFLDKYFPCGMNFYRDTKALSTQRAIEFAEERNINLTVIEPTWVYGEREFHTGFYQYIKTAKSGIPFMPGSSRNRFHVIYAKDLAKAYYKVYRNKTAGIQRIIAGNEYPEKMEKIWSIFCRELGIKKPYHIPKWIIYPAGFLMEWLFTLFGSKKAPTLTRGRVNMFYDNIEYSTEKAKKVLSFTSKYSLDEGIHNTVQWYKQHNLI